MKVRLEKIKELRVQRGWSQENMAQELGITQPQYGRLENGENEFDFDKLTRITEIFQVNPTDIIEFEEKQIYINSYNSTTIGNNSNNNNSSITTDGFSKEEIIQIVQEEVSKLLRNQAKS